MTPVDFEQVLDLANQLPRTKRAELIARLAHDLAVESTRPVADSDAWATMERLRDEFAHLPHGDGTVAEQLERDRADRQAILEGQHNVHA